MFYITIEKVIEQEGEPEFFVTIEDLRSILSDVDIRSEVLLTLGRDSILLAGTEETFQINLDFTEMVSTRGGGYHSKL